MTTIEVFKDTALSTEARNDLYPSYTDAKLAHLKRGGNIPYLSRSEVVNMHILIHLRQFKDTRIDPGNKNANTTDSEINYLDFSDYHFNYQQ